MKNPKNIILLGVALILVFGTGFAIVKNQKKFVTPIKNEESKKEEEIKATDKETTNEKSDNAPADTKPLSTNQPTPTVNTAVNELKGVTLTIYLITDPIISQDGKTTVAKDSITPYFYPDGSGVYSVQKLSGSNWVDVATSINYPGHGGISAAYAGPAEDDINYRVLKIESGKINAVSKTFVVKRSDLTGGVKTYN